MGGLREKKKRETRERIVDAARGLLFSKGYAGVIMEEIAGKAEIGVGTLYNYFASKAEIFVSIMSGELSTDENDLAQWEYDLEQDAAQIVIDYLLKYYKNIKLFGKRVWRELFAAMLGNTKPDNLLFKGILKIDIASMDKIERLLDSVKEKRILPASFRSRDAAHTIYSIIITQTILYAYTEEITAEQYANGIEDQIRFLFEGKCGKEDL